MTLQAARRGDANARRLQRLAPRTPRQLHAFLRAALGVDVLTQTIEDGSSPAFAYLCHAFFERGDAVVWASRGGGKTMMGAAATLLDLVFKPGIQVRVLGGSFEQSRKMYEHLMTFFDRPALGGLLADTPTRRRIELTTGSAAELLSQSHRSVRGTRVHRLRCDEVEEFDEDVWQAAQLVTRSGVCGRTRVRGSVEALSTMHRPFGLMSRLLSRGGAAVFKWSAMDVIARCEPERACEGCDLWADCRGRAKAARGFVPVEDLLQQRRRVSDETWASEMMCRRPRVSENVYPRFSTARHVFGGEVEMEGAALACGMDFGLRCAVVLWAAVRGRGEEAEIDVLDEFVGEGMTTGQYAALIRGARWGRPAWVGADPSGAARNGQTGLSDLEVLRRGGLRVREARSRVSEGVDRVRRRLDRGTLRVHARCVRLIEALRRYHFDPARPWRSEPIKDGPDHACDALRYLVVNAESCGGAVRVRPW